jgi:lysyl-tRNA synthetase class 2
MRSLCVGEEAVVRPDAFTLEGRAVRKLRQSVHRVERRGWRIVACDGADIDLDTEAEIDALELAWRTTKRRLLGFAMGMGPYEGGIASGDLFVLARSPDGRLAASMRFISHRGKLSLDTMRRVGDTPNGLNEALVCTALELARQRRIPEVSLNYAGLAHLLRSTREGGWVRRRATSIVVAALGRHFQMERLVRFNDKFSPEWRPRHLVYGSRRGLPGAMLRVLQAEGYVPHRTEQAESQVMREPARAAVSPESMRAGATGR